MRKPPEPPASGLHTARRVAKNSFYLFASRIFEIATTLIITSLTARYLGVNQFGSLAIATAIAMTLIPLADFGIERIICREIARDAGRSSLYVSTTLCLRAGLSVVILAAAAVLLRVFSTWPESVNRAVLLAIAAELVWSTGMTYLSVVKAFEQMQYELFINIAFKLSSLLLVAAVVLCDWGFLAIFQARLASSILFLLLSAALLYRKFVPLEFRFDSKLAGFMLKESYPLAIAALALALIFKVDVFLLQWLGTQADVSYFEAPNRLILQLQVLPVAFSLALFPVLSRTAAGGSNAPLSQYYANAFKFLLIVSVPFSVLLFVGSKPLIVAIFGPAFERASISLDILAPTVVFLFLIALQNLFLTAVGRQVLNTVTTVSALVLNIVLGVLLIPRYGYIGASIGTSIAYFAMMVLNSLFVRRFGVRMGNGSLVGKVVCSAALMSVTLFIDMGHYLVTMAVRFAAAGAIYLGSMILLKALSKEDLATIRDIVSKKRRPPVPTDGGRPFPNDPSPTEVR
jgi:O-antigen/teichoic acid export membrane protein